MPLDVDTRIIRQGTDRARHRQLADHIRSAIASGQLVPDEPLPSEGELATRTGLSKTTVTAAINILVTEGLVVKRAGAPSRVAVPPPNRHMATARYAAELARLRELGDQPHPHLSAFTDAHDVGWDEYTVRAVYLEDVANPDDARRLELEVGAPVLRRHLEKSARHHVVQIQDSVLPLDLVRDTPVADQSKQPWPGGTMAELWAAGLIVGSVLEEAQARMATVVEQETLGMPAPAVVIVVNRVFAGQPQYGWADGVEGDLPLEASTVVCPAAGMTLRWETRL